MAAFLSVEASTSVPAFITVAASPLGGGVPSLWRRSPWQRPPRCRCPPQWRRPSRRAEDVRSAVDAALWRGQLKVGSGKREARGGVCGQRTLWYDEKRRPKFSELGSKSPGCYKYTRRRRRRPVE